jgi:hypothetical protein
MPISHVHLVNTPSFADITFSFANGAKVPAHSCIVFARCPSLVQAQAAAPKGRMATLRRPVAREQPGNILYNSMSREVLYY